MFAMLEQKTQFELDALQMKLSEVLRQQQFVCHQLSLSRQSHEHLQQRIRTQLKQSVNIELLQIYYRRLEQNAAVQRDYLKQLDEYKKVESDIRQQLTRKYKYSKVLAKSNHNINLKEQQLEQARLDSLLSEWGMLQHHQQKGENDA